MIIGGWRGPGWRVVDADPGQGGQIRHWIKATIAQHDCPVDRDEAELTVGELFANAVMHGPAGGRVLVGYCLWSGGARIVVCDGGGPTVPVLRTGNAQAENWRGLQVVDALAARWGSFRLAWPRTTLFTGGGLAPFSPQVVWCDLGQPLLSSAGDAWAWLRLVLLVDSLSAPDQPEAVAPGALLAVRA